MLNLILSKLDKSMKKRIKSQSTEIKNLKRQLRVIQEKLIDDFIITINEIQDVQARPIEEKQKDKLRDNIIDHKRLEYVSKVIELSNTDQSIDNSKHKII